MRIGSMLTPKLVAGEAGTSFASTFAYDVNLVPRAARTAFASFSFF